MSIFILMIKDSTEVYGYSGPQVGMHGIISEYLCSGMIARGSL